MSKWNPKPLLIDMLHCIEKIPDYTSGLSYESFLADSKTKDAIAKNIQILGEAAKKFLIHLETNIRILNGPKSFAPGILSPMIMMILILPLSGK